VQCERRKRENHVPISIKNVETEQLARELAKETGETITEVIKRSLQDRLQRLRGRRHARGLPEQVEDILQRMDTLPTLDDRAEDEIVGYDQDGIPVSLPKNGSSSGD
jgi:antitoxin VapB